MGGLLYSLLEGREGRRDGEGIGIATTNRKGLKRVSNRWTRRDDFR